MSSIHAKTSRRAFVLNGGATLGAGAVAATAGTAVLPSDELSVQEQLARREDSDAIRKVHAQFIAAVESSARAGAVDTHRAYRANAQQQHDVLQLGAERREATASWHVDVQVATPLVGDSTVAQMARLQGQFGTLRWEAGRLEARYEKTHGVWQMNKVEYIAT